jgi:hypothetical protein
VQNRSSIFDIVAHNGYSFRGLARPMVQTYFCKSLANSLFCSIRCCGFYLSHLAGPQLRTTFKVYASANVNPYSEIFYGGVYEIKKFDNLVSFKEILRIPR